MFSDSIQKREPEYKADVIIQAAKNQAKMRQKFCYTNRNVETRSIDNSSYTLDFDIGKRTKFITTARITTLKNW